MKFLPFLLVCTWLSAQNQKFTLNGECQDCPDQFVYISQMSENGEIIDTVKLVDGKFYFEKKIKYEEWYQIRCQNKKKDGILELFTNPTEQVQVSFKAIGKMYHAVVKGSPASIDRFNYINGRSIFVKEKDILLKMKTDYEESKIPTPINLLNKIDSLDAEIEDITFKTIMKTSSLLLKDLCLIGIKSPLYFNLIRNYLDSLKNSKEGSHDFENLRKSFHHYSERSLMEDNPQVEKFTMNFDFLSNVGTQITRQNIGNKYLLIDFWASWCKPCREANKKVNDHHSVFQHPKLYTLFVSLDKDQNKWQEAIKQDGLEWANHAIDAYSYEKSFAKSIGVSYIPTNLLVDSNGMIILQNATPEDVKAFLDKLK